jgi:heme exporter protein A
MATSALELRDLGCVRGGRALFGGLNLSLPGGTLLRVTGANGAGKTSLLRMVCGLLRPARGDVLWQGTRIGTLREEFHRQLVYLGHAAALKDDLTASENLRVAARLAGADADAAQSAAALSATGVLDCEHRPVRSLSQGQRRRVALAQLLVRAEAALWVLDEPFNALDATATAWLVDLISAKVSQGGLVLLTSHLPHLPLAPRLSQAELAL